MANLKRDEKIKLILMGDNSYDVVNSKGEISLWADEEYYIYFKNVNFREHGAIEGRYLGETSDSITDGYCREVSYDRGIGFTVEGNLIKTAKMVAVNNKNRTIVIIQD